MGVKTGGKPQGKQPQERPTHSPFNRIVMQGVYEKCNSEMWPGFNRLKSHPVVSSIVTAAEPLGL
jgi:hypothetical protein